MSALFTNSNKKVIFFDLNNTLLDITRTQRYCFTEMMSEWTQRWTEDPGLGEAERLWKSYQNSWKRQAGISDRKQRIRISLKETVQTLPLPLNDTIFQFMQNRYQELEQETAFPFPGLTNALHQLKDDYKLAVISNGTRENALNSIQRMGLEAFFPANHVIDSQSAGYRKPHKRIFTAAMKQMNVKANQTVMVGDSLRIDIQGAVNAGMDAVWANFTNKKKPFRLSSEKAYAAVVTKPEELVFLFR